MNERRKTGANDLNVSFVFLLYNLTKMIMKKSVRNYKVNGEQFAYVLDCINVDGDFDCFANDKARIAHFFQMFEIEYDYPGNKKRQPNEQKRIAEYLQGLPTCFSIAYANDDIEQIGKSWGYCKTEKEAERFVNNWFEVIAFRLIQLRKLLND